MKTKQRNRAIDRVAILEQALRAVAAHVVERGQHTSLEVFEPHPIAADLNAQFMIPSFEPEIEARLRALGRAQ